LKKNSNNRRVDLEEVQKNEQLLVTEDVYLTAGVHIGTQQKSADMKPFIFRVRTDGLYVLDVKQTDSRLREASKFLSRYDPKEILVVSTRQYGQKPVRIFAKHTNVTAMPGRFVPGTLTNPQISAYLEPRVLMVTDPAADQQALREAVTIGIPVVGICDANNETRNVDLIIPANNKGRMSLAAIYWILTKEILKNQGKIQKDEDFTPTMDEFEATL
jgi:small subunit ribosomal protein S2